MTGIWHPSSSSSTNMIDNANSAFELHVYVLTSLFVLTSFIIVLSLRSLYRRNWEERNRSNPEKSLTCHWISFIDSHAGGWTTVTVTGIPQSLNCLSLLTLSTNAGPITLLCTGPGILCALTGVFVSMVYARNRHLLEFVMKDKRVTVLPFDIWTFLSLPYLFMGWSVLFYGVAVFFLFFPLLTRGHHPFLSKAAILGIPVPILSTGLSILVTSIPCGLIAQYFQVLSRARGIEPGTTPESLKPMEQSFPSVLESTEAVTSEKLLGLVPAAAYAILVFCPALLANSDFYNDPITRISLKTAIIAGSFGVILLLPAILQPAARAKRALVLPVSFLALSVLAFFFSLLAHFWTDEE